MIYNGDYGVVQFCDGTDWVGMASQADAGLPDGDKGDITVSGGGLAWSVDSGAISYAKLQNVSATARLLGRASAGAGVVEELSLGTGLSFAGTTLNVGGLGGSAISADALDFTELKDAMALDASTDIAASGTSVLSITNAGTGNSFVVNDQASDTTPFVIDASGNVGIGTTAPGVKLEVKGAIEIGGTEAADEKRVAFAASDGSDRFTVETDLEASTGNDLLGFRSTTVDSILVLKGDGSVGIGTTTPDQRLHSEQEAATTNSVLDVLRLTRTTSGTPALGIGVGIEFEVETAANNNKLGATIEAVTTNVGSGTEAFDLRFYTMTGGAAPSLGMTLGPTGIVTAAGGFSGDGSSLTALNATNLAIGTVANARLDPTLTALGNYNTNGILVQTAADTFAGRSLAGTASEITITNGDGVAGNPTIGLASVVNLASKTLRLPSSTTLPASCAIGDVYMDTDATAGQRLLLCEAANSWAAQGGGSGGSVAADSLDFTEFKDAMALDVSTTIVADGDEVLSIINTGTGNSFVVNDQASDTTPFVIDAAGNVAIGGTTANASALLDLTSTTQGFLPPRMTTAQRNAIATPANGLVVYDTDADLMYIYTTSGWSAVGGAGGTGMAWRTNTWAIPTSGYTDVPFNVGNQSLVNISHSTTVDPERMTIAKSGIYLVSFSASVFGTSTTGASVIWTRLGVNGNAIAASLVMGRASVAGGPALSNSAVLSLTAGDYITLQALGQGLTSITSASMTITPVGGVGGISPGIVAVNSLDFSEFKNAMTLDTSTAIEAGSNTLSLTGSGSVLAATSSSTSLPALRATNETTTTNAAINALRLTAASTGTPLSGIGTGLQFETETAPGNLEIGATLSAVATNVGSGTEAFDLVLRTMAGGTAAAERLRISSAGTISATLFSGSGASLTALNASNMTSGTVPTARLGTGTADSTSFLRGDGTWATPTASSVAADSLDFTEFKDSLALDANTTIDAGSNFLSITGTAGISGLMSITNTGAGDSLVVFDQASDTTPFVINGAGNVGIGTNNPTASLELTGSLALSGVLSPASVTADQNNYNPSGLSDVAILRLSSDASRSITGLGGGIGGRVISIFNIGSNDIVLKHQGIGSTAANRFAIGSDLTIGADQSIALVYDGTSQRWRAAGAPFDSGGGAACPNTTQVFDAVGLTELYVPGGCIYATMEAWGAGGGAGVPPTAGGVYGVAGGGGGGSVVVRDTGGTVLVVGGGGGGAGAGMRTLYGASGGGGGYGKTATNIAVIPNEKLRVYVGDGGGSGCAGATWTASSSGANKFSGGGGYNGGAGTQNANGLSSTYGGGGGPWSNNGTLWYYGGNSVYGGGGGSYYVGSVQTSYAGGTSTYGGSGGLGYYGTSPLTSPIGGRGGSGLGSVTAAGTAGTVALFGTSGSAAGGAGASGGGLSAGAGAGWVRASSNTTCDIKGGSGRVRIVWSN